MGGAFTAVADDGSAAFWNPAGFASGSFFSLVVDANILDRRSGRARRARHAAARPFLLPDRYRGGKERPKHARSAPCRRDAGPVPRGPSGGRDDTETGARDRVAGGTARRFPRNKFDADLGVMATGSLAQLGLSVRNLLQPEFERRRRGDSSRSAGPGRGVDPRTAERDRGGRRGSDDRDDPAGGVAGRGAGGRGAPGPEGLAPGRGPLEHGRERPARGRRRSAASGAVMRSTARPWRMPR